METTFASRVLAFRKHKGLSQQAFAEQCGLEQGNITQMERGTDPKSGNMAKIIAGFPDLNPDWLLLGTGEMLRDGRELTRLPADPAPATPTAGPLSVVPESDQVKELKEQLRELREHNRLLRDLLRSGVDLSKVQATGSFNLSIQEAAEPLAVMRIAA
ncbi:helix-turn-helix domain-containing protein [Hymenobacter sp. BT18]|uniref:helix-turn-helix domain-containing protein n=1 Tax=Hymenobacter sp. BT18 TaxID=2835648 RepID=UPI00143E69EA|nr:helix-turn-helix transcriptional regulator [Hymenobacter sp. BT18]QIX61828.1 helix-turn-helix domain-containing protein [Hymenobacter sp. BT18]